MLRLFVIGIAAIELGAALYIFNRIIALRQDIEEARSTIFTQLEKRNVALEKMLEVVNAAKDHEVAIQTAIAAMRGHATSRDFAAATEDEVQLRDVFIKILD